MSPKLPVVTGKEMARVAEKAGFVLRRRRGSHAVYVRPSDQARVVIPMHSGAALKRKTLHGIIHDMKLTLDAFRDLL